MMIGPSGIGLAIPQSLAQPVYDSLIKNGEVVRSAIGVAFKAIKRSDYKEGVIVNSVLKGAAADKAGLKAGDLVISMNGEPVTVRFPEEVPLFSRKIADLPVGSAIKLGYRRGTATS